MKDPGAVSLERRKGIAMKQYDIAAYIWPSYTGKEPRSRQFWEQGIGEWQSVLSAEKRTEDQILPRKPLWGTVDEADPAVMEFQIKEALRHGVNVFIYDWYWYDRRPFLEQCLDEGFLGAPNNTDMKFYLMWANHDAGYAWDKRQSDLDELVWLGSQPREEFDRVCLIHRAPQGLAGQDLPLHAGFRTEDGLPFADALLPELAGTGLFARIRRPDIGRHVVLFHWLALLLVIFFYSSFRAPVSAGTASSDTSSMVTA